nr:hypothetical protein [uncultured Acetatifactor sp.]
MTKSILKLEPYKDNSSHPNSFRTIFKTKHGRIVFLALSIDGTGCTITDCFYIDRNQGRTGAKRYSSKPQKMQTFQFGIDALLSVIASELDKKFYGVEYIQTSDSALPLDQYLQMKSECAFRKYHFLIMIGNGEQHNGLPARLRTRLKNKLHRSIYVELAYYKNGQGVISQCYYYDRMYKRKGIKVTPPMLTSCFFPYNQKEIINLLNHEICCDFTHMIVTDGIDIDSNRTPLCGAL